MSSRDSPTNPGLEFGICTYLLGGSGRVKAVEAWHDGDGLIMIDHQALLNTKCDDGETVEL